MSDKHKFALRLIARQGRHSEATAIENQIEESANKLTMSKHWLELWDEEESVRWLSVFAMPDYRPSATEEPLIAFVRAHPQYFYSERDRSLPIRPNAVVLWPNLKRLEQKWKKTQSTDYNAAAEEMNAMLKKAGLKAPGRTA